MTPTYLNEYLPNKFIKWRENPKKADEYKRILQNLQRPMEDPKYAAAIGKLKKEKIKTPEEYAAAYPSGQPEGNQATGGSESGAGSSSVQPSAGYVGGQAPRRE